MKKPTRYNHVSIQRKGKDRFFVEFDPQSKLYGDEAEDTCFIAISFDELIGMLNQKLRI